MKNIFLFKSDKATKVLVPASENIGIISNINQLLYFEATACDMQDKTVFSLEGSSGKKFQIITKAVIPGKFHNKKVFVLFAFKNLARKYSPEKELLMEVDDAGFLTIKDYAFYAVITRDDCYVQSLEPPFFECLLRSLVISFCLAIFLTGPEFTSKSLMLFSNFGVIWTINTMLTYIIRKITLQREFDSLRKMFFTTGDENEFSFFTKYRLVNVEALEE